MPRQKKPARLWLRPERLNEDGSVRSEATWLILDGGKQIPTRCLRGEVAEAERILNSYMNDKYDPRAQGLRALAEVPIIDVLDVYVDHKKDDILDLEGLKRRCIRLASFFGDMTLADITGETVRAYARSRGPDAKGGTRRDLEDLRAAINYHRAEGLHREPVGVPVSSERNNRTRYLERHEVARLVWTAMRHKEQTRIPCGPRKGMIVPSKSQRLRHLARFILIGVYTGTRAGAIASASWEKGKGKSYIDLRHGLYYRLAEGKKPSRKRQPTIEIPPHLLAHMRRWAKADGYQGHVVEYRGEPISRVKNGFKSLVQLAGLENPEEVIPHTLRHTAATWLMQSGEDLWKAAGYLGMSPQVLINVYGHHHPDHQRFSQSSFKPKRIVGPNVGPKPLQRVDHRKAA